MMGQETPDSAKNLLKTILAMVKAVIWEPWPGEEASDVTAEAFKLVQLCWDKGSMPAMLKQEGQVAGPTFQGRQENACWPDKRPCPYPSGEFPKKRIGRIGADAPRQQIPLDF